MKISKLKIFRNKSLLIKFVLILIISVSLLTNINYTSTYSATDYSFNHQTYSNSKIPTEFNNFRIAYMSDLNLTNEKSVARFSEIAKDINKENIDMFIFGGDIYNTTAFDNENVINIFKSIKTSYGKFAVYGEKDLTDTITSQTILNEGGFEILHNETRRIYYNNSFIDLFGLENNGDVSGLINDYNRETFKLATVHQPDYFNKSSEIVDLQISGHTMGGVVKLPLIGGLFTNDEGKTYVSGEHNLNKSDLIISNGISLDDYTFRLFTQNEINIIELNKPTS